MLIKYVFILLTFFSFTKEKLQIGEHVATKDIYLLRDFLIVRILFSNAQRAGVISNVTMADYRKGKSGVIQDNHIMRKFWSRFSLYHMSNILYWPQSQNFQTITIL